MLPVLAGFNPSGLNGPYCGGQSMPAGYGQISRKAGVAGLVVMYNYDFDKSERDAARLISSRASFLYNSIHYTAKHTILGCVWIAKRTHYLGQVFFLSRYYSRLLCYEEDIFCFA